MKRLLIAGLILAAAAAGVHSQAASPFWAYGFTSAGPEPAPIPCQRDSKPLDCARVQPTRPKEVVHRLPDSKDTFTEYEVHFDYGPADWYPEDHPVMPEIVARGRESDKLRPCALCHYPNGHGRIENASPGGLPAAYLLQQLEAFRNGARRSADPRKANTNEMIQIARLLTDAEMKESVEYFASIKRRPWVRVVEADSVPKTRVGVNGLFLPLPGNDMEPLGRRILEVPENPDLTDKMRSPRSGWLAYVPPGSVARGREIATTGGGVSVQCGACHGAGLQGMGNVPRIADLPASYLIRQMYDIQAGTRASQLMKPVVATMTQDDMIAVAAYLASL
jgi:cytochrome c553